MFGRPAGRLQNASRWDCLGSDRRRLPQTLHDGSTYNYIESFTHVCILLSLALCQGHSSRETMDMISDLNKDN